MLHGKYYTTHYTSVFIFNQCTYFPKGMTKILADEMMKVYLPEEQYPREQRYGALLNYVLQHLGIHHLVYRPTLVNHKDVRSTFKGSILNRNTIYFKDYLDKLGITMEEAYLNENREKLMQLLEADRNKWYKE